MRIAYRPQVGDDLRAIRVYGIETWGIDRTLAFLGGLAEAIERLIENPRVGRPRDAIAAGLRSIRYRGYQVLYEISGDAVVITAILHERRNLSALDFADRLEGE